MGLQAHRICINSSLYYSSKGKYCNQGGDPLPSVLELSEHHTGFHCQTCRSYNLETPEPRTVGVLLWTGAPGSWVWGPWGSRGRGEWVGHKCGVLGSHCLCLNSGPTPFTALCFPEAHFSHLENGDDVRTSIESWCEEQEKPSAPCLANGKYRVILTMMRMRLLMGDLVTSPWVSRIIFVSSSHCFLLQNDENWLLPWRDPIPKSLWFKSIHLRAPCRVNKSSSLFQVVFTEKSFITSKRLPKT